MAVAFDAFTASTAGIGNLTITHSPVGTPRAAIVFVVQNANANDRVSGVTYGTDAMTEMTGSPLAKGTGQTSVIYGYFLGTSIPTGDQTVTVTVTAGATKQAGVITLTAGADTTIQDVDATITSDSLENPSVTLSAGGNTVFAAIGFHSGIPDPANITPLTNWTARLEEDFGSATGGWYTFDTIGASDVTAGWTQGADDAQMIAVAVTEVAAPSTTHPGWVSSRGGWF